MRGDLYNAPSKSMSTETRNSDQSEYPGIPSRVYHVLKGFLGKLALMSLLFTIFSLPALLMMNLVSETLAGYGAIALLASIVQTASYGIRHGDEDSVPLEDMSQRAIYALLVVWVVMVSGLLALAGAVGWLMASQFGFPVLGLVLAALTPTIDKEINDRKPEFSPTSIIGYATALVLIKVGYLHNPKPDNARQFAKSRGGLIP